MKNSNVAPPAKLYLLSPTNGVTRHSMMLSDARHLLRHDERSKIVVQKLGEIHLNKVI